jgi:hypothetical protein
LHIKASIGGGSFNPFMIDTGSIGILVGSSYVGPNVMETDTKFSFEYSSSGNKFEGVWAVSVVEFQADEHVYTASQVSSQQSDESRTQREEQIPDTDKEVAGKVTAKTYPMFFRKVTKMWSPGGWVDNPEVFMLGIGFDRNEAGDTPPPGLISIPSLNPFGMLEGMYDDPANLGIKPGYIISTDRVEIGLTTASSTGFNIIELDFDHEQLNLNDWKAPMVKVSVPTASPSIEFEAILLVDTGLGYSIVQAPDNVNPPLKGPAPNNVQDGQKIIISSLNPAGDMYDFVVCDHEDSTPETSPVIPPDHVSWRHNLHNGVPFINTSRYALSQVDYLVDLKAGHLGYRKKN